METIGKHIEMLVEKMRPPVVERNQYGIEWFFNKKEIILYDVSPSFVSLKEKVRDLQK